MNNPSPEIAAKKLLKSSPLRPGLAIVLGSGFHCLVKEMQLEAQVPYRRLPGFPPVTVQGHVGEVLLGRLGSTPVMLLSGRAHYYEGHSMATVTFPIRTLAAYGIRDLLLTNAAGGINQGFCSGDFMLLKDHINLMGANPLRGWPKSVASGFVDLTRVYDGRLRRLLQRAARACGTELRSGVYLAVSGPSYETPAEIRAFSRLGADAVGMSTVPEAIVARHCGLRVAALSCITNVHGGTGAHPLSHVQVLQTAQRVHAVAANMLLHFANFYAAAPKIPIEKEGVHCNLNLAGFCR